MSRITILGIAAFACGSSLALAESGIALGPDTKLHLTADGQVRFDDNVRLSANNEDSDTVFVIAPGIDLNYNGGLSKGNLVVVEQIIRYADVGDLDGELFSAVGEYSYEGAMTKVMARAGYRELSQGSVTIRNREEAVEHDVANASIDAIWSATAKTRIGAGLFYDSTSYPDGYYSDRESYGLPIDLYYEVSPKLDVSMGYRYRRSLVDRPTALPSSIAWTSQDSKDHFFNVGARGEFTPKLNGQVRVGYGVRNFDEVALGLDDSQGMLSFMGALTYVYSPKASFDFSMSNDFSNSATGTSQEILAFRAGGRFEFTPQWSAQAGLSYESTDYARPSTRNDDFITGDVGVSYTFNENVSVYGSYVHRTNSSNDDVYDLESNVLSLGVSLRY
jgi:predicted porin